MSQWELRHQEGATSRCSARQNWSTKRAFHSPQCAEEMSQTEIWRTSRSLPERLDMSWFAAQNWLDWRDVHCDGQISTRRPHLLSIAWRVRQVSEELVFNTEQIKKKCTMNLEKSNLIVVGSFTADSNLLQPTGCCELNTLTRHIFSCFTAHISMSHVTVAQGVLRTSSMCHLHVVVVVLILFDPLLCTLHRLSHLHLPCGLVRWEVPCVLPRMRS